MSQRTLSLGWVILLSLSSAQAQTTGVWNKAFSEASAKSFANAHGYAGVAFSPAIMSIPDKPFTAKRLYSDKRKENDTDAGAPVSAECTIARDTQGRVHYEMAFEGVQGDRLFIKSIDVEIYDPVAHKIIRYYTNADRSLPSEPIATIRNLRLMSELVRPLPPTPAKQEAGDTLTVATKPQPGETEQPASPPPVIFVPVKDNMLIESIDGIIVVGHRIIMKYGPQMQFFHIDETWFSPDFALDMRRTELRETIGTEIVETKDVVEGEPDPSLFRIPPGYIVRPER